jgi:hypothetical protein
MEKTRKRLYSVVAVCTEEGKDEVIVRDDKIFAIDDHDAEQILTIQQADKLQPFLGRMQIYCRPF